MYVPVPGTESELSSWACMKEKDMGRPGPEKIGKRQCGFLAADMKLQASSCAGSIELRALNLKM